MITPHTCSDDWPFQSDRVTIAYFPDAAAMAEAQTDPAHAALEGDRYAADSVWLVAAPLPGLSGA